MATDRNTTRTRSEVLFEFRGERTRRSWRCELRDHGRDGGGAQFRDPIYLRITRTFYRDMDPTRTPRQLAIAWAIEERHVIEQSDGT